MKYFKLKLNTYYADIIDYALENRRVVRIVMLESLKEGNIGEVCLGLWSCWTAGPKVRCTARVRQRIRT